MHLKEVTSLGVMELVGGCWGRALSLGAGACGLLSVPQCWGSGQVGTRALVPSCILMALLTACFGGALLFFALRAEGGDFAEP